MQNIRKRTIVLWGALGLAAACADDSLTQVFPSLQICESAEDTVCAPPVHLGSLRSGKTHTAHVVLRNVGKGVLNIDSAEVVAGNVQIGTDMPGPIGSTRTGLLPVVLTPIDGANSATLAVTSDDPDNPRREFGITYDGVQPVLIFCTTDVTPQRCSDALVIDIGSVRLGQVEDVQVLVRNAGTEDISLAGANVDPLTSVFGELSVVTSTGPGFLAAGADSPMTVRYQPQDGLPDSVLVTLVPEDATLAGATLTVNAAAPANNPPVAVAVEYYTRMTTAYGEVGVGTWLDGSGSSDPIEGDPLQFAWSVTAAPAGSVAQTDTPNARLTRFAPDVIGVYLVQLLVTDSLGVADFADVLVIAQPQLHVKASWGTNAGDVDLHLVAQPAGLFDPEDCYFAQANPGWGTAATTDDPRFTLDDTSGNGSEVVSILQPAAGSYDIWLYYFDDAGGQTANVTIDVTTMNGSNMVSVQSGAGTLNTTCDRVHVGTVDWPAGTFTAVGATSNQCN